MPFNINTQQSWLVIIGVVVCLCAIFLGKIVIHVVSPTLFSDHIKPNKVLVRKTNSTSVNDVNVKDSTSLVTKNMFCASCVYKPSAIVNYSSDGEITIPITSLPLRLVATNIATNAKLSFATIVNTEDKTKGGYLVSDLIPQAGKIKTIHSRYVDFINESSGLVERIVLDTDQKIQARSHSSPSTKKRSKKTKLSQAIADGIKKTGENQYEIERAVIEKIMGDPSAMKGVRIVPAMKNGKPNGFKIYAVRKSSPFHHIGLKNGDVLNAINGFELSSPDKALEIYIKVREVNNLSLSLTRKGSPVTIDYTIR